MWMRFFSVIFLSLIPFSALAVTDLECNESQTKCVVRDASLTIGDRVAVFNTRDEVIALGKVKKMRGEKRSIKIVKNYGRIYRGYRVALLDADVSRVNQVETNYNIYKPYADSTFGVNYSFASIGVGEYLSGGEVSGYGQWEAYRHLDYVLRGMMIKATGKIARGHALLGIERQEMSYLGAGIIPGFSATAFEKDSISFRGELGAGFIYTSADIGGDSSLLEGHGYQSKMSNGFGFAARAGVSLQLNMNPWRAEVMASQTKLHDALIASFGLGLSRDMD